MSALIIDKNGVEDVVYTPLAVNEPFHASTAPNLLLFGGAGSGKSFCMRFDAYMRCLMIPQFRALIVRRSMPELRLSHLERVPFEAARLGLPKEAWHSTEFTLRFPNGSRLKFRHVEDDNALAEYLSSEFDAIYFDELVTFTQRQFLFLSSRARTDKPGIKPIVRAGTNPIGPGASWVKRMFIDKNITKEEIPGYAEGDYAAIFSTVDDNPHVDVVDYEKRLQSLPSEALRKAMRYGEWVQEGQAFSEWREAQPDGRGWHVIDQMPSYRGKPIQEADHIEIVRVVDWGYAATGNPGMCVWYACLTDGSAIGFQEYVFKETLPADAANEIKRRSQGLRVRYTVGDTAMWQEHEGPSIAECFAAAGVSMVEADKAREAGWVQLHVWLRETVNDGLIERPRLSFLRSGCPVTIRTMPQMVVDPTKPGDLVTRNVEDEGADCNRYFVMSRPGRSQQKKADPAIAWIFKDIAKRKRVGSRLGSEATRRIA